MTDHLPHAYLQSLAERYRPYIPHLNTYGRAIDSLSREDLIIALADLMFAYTGWSVPMPWIVGRTKTPGVLWPDGRMVKKVPAEEDPV
jgi:hypothetical protein